MPARRKLIPLDAFKALAKKGETLPDDTGVMKGFAGIQVKAEGEGLGLEIRVTTATRDRDRDTVAPAGWKLANYRKNPVVLYAHNYWDLPIGKDTGLTVDELGLIGHPEFTPQDLYPLGFTCYRMLRGGFLNAASVGFSPHKWTYNEEEGGYDFLEQELLEYSIVPVPANPEALVGAKAAGIDLAPLKAWAEQYLDTCNGESGLWLPKAKAERVMKLLEGERRVVYLPKTIAGDAAKALATELGEGFVVIGAEAAPPADPPVPPAPKAVDPIDPPAPPAEDLVFELADEPEEEKGILGDMTAEELRDLLGPAVTAAVSAKLTALTGRLD